jgi:hypothetical protein
MMMRRISMLGRVVLGLALVVGLLSQVSLRARAGMANCHSSGDWQFKRPVAMALPTVVLKAGWLSCWQARFLLGRVAR